MYRRSCGRILSVSDDLTELTVKIKLSWKNVNYNGSIFGGSLFAATDPIFMIMYNELLENNYILWDKSAGIDFKKPAKEDVYVDFKVEASSLPDLIREVNEKGFLTFHRTIELKDKTRTKTFATIDREIYIATFDSYRKHKERSKM